MGRNEPASTLGFEAWFDRDYVIRLIQQSQDKEVYSLTFIVDIEKKKKKENI